MARPSIAVSLALAVLLGGCITEPNEGVERSPGTFGFIWIVGNETFSVLDGPEGHPPPPQQYCGHGQQDSPQFVHEVDPEAKEIMYRGEPLVPQQTLLALDHFQAWNDCALAYALFPDSQGQMPFRLGRGGVVDLTVSGGEVSVDGEALAPGEVVPGNYTSVERHGPYTLRYEGAYEVRHEGQWPLDALRRVE